MSPVDFNKRQCPLSLFLLFISVDFKRVQCRLSNVRKGRVTLSNLRVNGPYVEKIPMAVSCVHQRRVKDGPS